MYRWDNTYRIENLMTYQSDAIEQQGVCLYKKFVPVGYTCPLHWHDFIEFELIVEGTAEHIYNGNTYTITAGSAYMMYYYDFHEVKPLTDLKLYTIHFDKSMLSQELWPYLGFNKFHCQFEQDQMEQMIQKLTQLEEEASESQPLRKLMIQNILSEIMVTMIRKSTSKSDCEMPLPVQQAISYINANFRNDLTLEELAEKLSFSPNYLGQLIKKQTGNTFNEHLNILRLKYACSLLSASDLTIKEVALAAGYNSVEYLLYIFKKKMLITPNEYRRKQKELIKLS